mgnify:CR=1 FL=1
MTPQDALVRIIEHREIFHDEMLTLMRQIMNGEMSPTLIAAIIIDCASRRRPSARSPLPRRSCANSPPR